MVNASRFRLNEAEQDGLKAGAAALGVELEASVVVKLCAFADLLGIWSERVNLISCHSARELVERHFLDSLAVEPLLPEGTLVDLGSGAGFPGVPLALLRPNRRVILVETRRRRANFLREVRRTLHLDNVEILEQRAEIPPGGSAQLASAVVSRAVWSESSLLQIAASWLVSEGELFWMRTDPLEEELSVSSKLTWARRVRYRIGGDRVRTIEVFRLAP